MAHALILCTLALLILAAQINVITMQYTRSRPYDDDDDDNRGNPIVHSRRNQHNDLDRDISSTAVCGTNGKKIMLFQNKYIMEQENHNNANEVAYKPVAIGFCSKQCELVCTNIYEPFCAIDLTRRFKRSFNNHCEMSRYSCLTNTIWTYYRNGPCNIITGIAANNHNNENSNKNIANYNHKRKRSERTDRGLVCTKFYNPVCATLYGVKSTFINECSVFAENKKTGKDWQIFARGVCAEDSAFALRMKSKSQSNIVNAKQMAPHRDDKPIVGSNNYALHMQPAPVQNAYTLAQTGHGAQSKTNQQYYERNNISSTILDAMPAVEEQSDMFSIIKDLLRGKDNSALITYSYTKLQDQVHPQYKVSEKPNAIPLGKKLLTTKPISSGTIPIQIRQSQMPMINNGLKSSYPDGMMRVFMPQPPMQRRITSNTRPREDKRSTTKTATVINGKMFANPMEENQNKFHAMSVNHMSRVDAIRGQRAITNNLQPYHLYHHHRPQAFSTLGRRFEKVNADVYSNDRQPFDVRNRKYDTTAETVNSAVENEKPSGGNVENNESHSMSKIQGIFDSISNLNHPENGNNKRVTLETYSENGNVHAIATKNEPFEFDSVPTDIVTEHPNQLHLTIGHDQSKKPLLYPMKVQKPQQLQPIFTYKDSQAKLLQNEQRVETSLPSKYQTPYEQQYQKILPQLYDKPFQRQRQEVLLQKSPVHNVELNSKPFIGIPSQSQEMPSQRIFIAPALQPQKHFQHNRHQSSTPFNQHQERVFFSPPQRDHPQPQPQPQLQHQQVQPPHQLSQQQQSLFSFNRQNDVNIASTPAQPLRWETQATNFLHPQQTKHCEFGAESLCAMLGSKTHEFNNYCEIIQRKKFYKEDWIVLHEGKCPITCNDVHCSGIYEPLCVSWNGLKYTIFNECQYRVAKCQDQHSDWKILNHGECQMDHQRIVEDDGKATKTTTPATPVPTTPTITALTSTTTTTTATIVDKTPISQKSVGKTAIHTKFAPAISITSKNIEKNIKSKIDVVPLHSTTEAQIVSAISSRTTTASPLESGINTDITLPSTTPQFIAITTIISATTNQPPMVIKPVKTIAIAIKRHKNKRISVTTENPARGETTNEPMPFIFPTTLTPNTSTPSIISTSSNTNNTKAHIPSATKRKSIYGPHMSSYIMRLIASSRKKDAA